MGDFKAIFWVRGGREGVYPVEIIELAFVAKTVTRRTDLNLVVLAAGEGRRMHSRIPKPLIGVCGRPMVQWVLEKGRKLSPARTIVVVRAHTRAQFAASLDGEQVAFAVQKLPRGTGDAVEAALPQTSRSGTLMVLFADMPLLDVAMLRGLLKRAKEGLALHGVELEDPAGYGRILQDGKGNVRGIVEERDADDEQKSVRTVYAGAMAGPCALFRELLPLIRPSLRTGERYLTDIIGLAVERNVSVRLQMARDSKLCLGTNSPADLSRTARHLELSLACELQEKGVRLHDAGTLRIRGKVRCGMDVEIDANVVLEGDIRLASGVKIGPNCLLRNVAAGSGTVIEAFSHIEDCRIGTGCRIGPFARIRNDVRIGSDVRIGNFVEVKNSAVGRGAKASHLSYLGDADVGARSNIGAGVITCNFDGKRKHRTVIGAGAFIGSDAQLVAPIRIGAGAVVGAGSTLTKDVPSGTLSVARARQVNLRRKNPAGRGK